MAHDTEVRSVDISVASQKIVSGGADGVSFILSILLSSIFVLLTPLFFFFCRDNCILGT